MGFSLFEEERVEFRITNIDAFKKNIQSLCLRIFQAP